MDGKRLIRTLRLQNFLSFGSEGEAIELQPLNVLIGANASGKSNVIEAISLLHATPKDLTAPIREGGGVSEWICKDPTRPSTARIQVGLSHPWGTRTLQYRIGLTRTNQRFVVSEEVLEWEHPGGRAEGAGDFLSRRDDGIAVLRTRAVPASSAEAAGGADYVERFLDGDDLRANESVLSQRKDPDLYPEITYVGQRLAEIRLYREWNMGQRAALRVPQPADLPNDFLLEDASNLGLVLNSLEHRGAKRVILKYLGRFYDAFDDYTVLVEGATVQVFVSERGLASPTPARRLSDGTLRLLCLLCILCHPEPPPLVCIEEPELGLHPDIIPSVADLLKEASQRTQLIVTTHSDMLVSALSELPEAVVVCERDDAGTHLRRLDPERLKKWLEDYSLGDLWLTGELGRTRW